MANEKKRPKPRQGEKKKPRVDRFNVPAADVFKTDERAKKVATVWLRRIVLGSFSPEFYRQMGVQRFRHPDTENMVLFYSLPHEEQKRIHEQWQADKSPHVTRVSPPEMKTLRDETKREQREQNEEEAAAGRADRKEMAKALKELKSKSLPVRIFQKEKRRLVQEIESRALVREKARAQPSA